MGQVCPAWVNLRLPDAARTFPWPIKLDLSVHVGGLIEGNAAYGPNVEPNGPLPPRRVPCSGNQAAGHWCIGIPGWGNEEGTFLACGFWLVEAFALLGDRPSAVRQMDALLEACDSNLGPLNEQLDAETGEMLGNVPQALSHLALVHAATAIARGTTRCLAWTMRHEISIGHLA